MHPKDADGMANSVDPDQTASSEAVWSWSALFAGTYLSQYIEFIRYFWEIYHISTFRLAVFFQQDLSVNRIAHLSVPVAHHIKILMKKLWYFANATATTPSGQHWVVQ